MELGRRLGLKGPGRALQLTDSPKALEEEFTKIICFIDFFEVPTCHIYSVTFTLLMALGRGLALSFKIQYSFRFLFEGGESVFSNCIIEDMMDCLREVKWSHARSGKLWDGACGKS